MYYRMQIITQKHFSVLNLYPCTLQVEKLLLTAMVIFMGTSRGNCWTTCDNSLSTNLECVLHLKYGIQKLHIDMCYKVMLHKCNSYCLRKNTVKTKDGDNVEWTCRFGYGDLNEETKRSSGKEIHPLHPLVIKGEHPRYESIIHDFYHILKLDYYLIKVIVIHRLSMNDSSYLSEHLTQYACRRAASTEDR